MGRPLVVALLNVYVGNKTPRKAVRALVRTGADSIGINEGMRVLPFLRLRPRYRVIVGEGGRSVRGFNDTPILTRKSLTSLGSGAFQVSEEVPASSRVAPDRWITVSCFRHRVGNVAHVNLHPNAAVQGRDDEVPRVREYAESMASLDRLLTFLSAEGFLPVVTGDVNYRPEPMGRRWEHSPYEVFAKHKLAHQNEGLDVVAWTRELRLARKVVLHRDRTGSDHPGIVAYLDRR